MKDAYNGRPVFLALAYRNVKARTEKAYHFGKENHIKGGVDLSPVDRVGVVKALNVSVPGSVVPPFNFPIFIDGETGVIVDQRNNRTPDGSVRNREEQGNVLIEGILEYLWCTDIGTFSGVRDNVAIIFGTWIGNAFRRYQGIDEAAMLQVRCLFAFYYWLRFASPVKYANYNKDDLTHAFFKLSKNKLRLTDEMVNSIFDTQAFQEILSRIEERRETEFDSTLLDSFCALIPDVVPTASMRSFTTRELIDSVLDRPWYGNNATPMAIAALEHPPTLMAMVAIADIKKSFYAKTTIGRIVTNLKSARVSAGDISKIVVEAIADQRDKYSNGHDKVMHEDTW